MKEQKTHNKNHKNKKYVGADDPVCPKQTQSRNYINCVNYHNYCLIDIGSSKHKHNNKPRNN